MEYIIKARISNRHVHLTKDVYDQLFSHPLTKRNDLNQKGEYASNETVTIKNWEKEIQNVRILGPHRSYNQIEISKRDARLLGLNPPVRKSGDLADSLNITLKGEKGSLEVKGVIIAERHVHMNKEDAEKFNVKDNDKVQIKVDGEKSGIMDAYVKVSDNATLELHIDTDDANAFLLEDYDNVVMIINN